jgi:3alpha(or 20beta)-hydroxysteroid dehydrogenase
MGRLDGKVALISGAARGQGEQEARLFAKEGARVVLGDVLEEGRAVAEAIGNDARFVDLDVTDEESWARTVKEATSSFGRLDILVNNAGIVRVAPIADCTLEQYMEVINVNQVGVFLGMKSVIGAMTESGGGSIVNISSIDGLIGMAGVVAYVSSKFAVRGMTKVAALELAEAGIRVNSIHPGFIDTPMLRGVGMTDEVMQFMSTRIPMKRVATPDEVAKLACFLASDESSYSTGSEFILDGGVTAGFSFGQ